MLNNVPNAINRLARNVVMNHPNSFNCQVFRKVITRAAPESGGVTGAASGIPGMGGLGVLDTMDEEDFDYVFLGNGAALPVEGFSSPSLMVNQGDASLGTGDEFRFLIEPEAPSGHEKWFDVRLHDVMYLLLGVDPDCARMAFEVMGIETVCGIPPYSVRYVTHRRDDLFMAAGSL